MQIYSGKNAVDYMPDLIGAYNMHIITDVKDFLVTGENLGFIVLMKNYKVFLSNGKAKFTQFKLHSSVQTKPLGSFMFVGTNPNFFHHLFNNVITGVFTGKTTVLDSKYQGAYSYEMIQIIKNAIDTFKGKI